MSDSSDPMDYSLPGSSVHGIFQSRVLEWGAIAFSENTQRHILIKLMKIKHKEQILKAAREKQQITHNGDSIRITADLSIVTL